MRLDRLAKTATLPNGMSVHYVSPPDVQFLYHEIFEEECYLQHGVRLDPDDVVIDVGGNIGMFAMFAARRCYRGRVITFEPIPPTYEALRRNARENLGGPSSAESGKGIERGGDVVSPEEGLGRQMPARDQPVGFPDAGGDGDRYGGRVDCGPAGAIYAYNCGVSDGAEASARFTFYPRAAGWSTMCPDDDETADNVTRFVEAALGGDRGSGGVENTPLAAFGRWLLSAERPGDVEVGSGGVLAAVTRAARRLARLVFTAVMGAVLKYLLSVRREFDCPLVTVSDVMQRHGIGGDGGAPGRGVGLLKVDVERAELAVLRGVSPRDWPVIRQVAMEVHSHELEAVKELLVGVGGFEPERLVVEQPPGLEGTTLWNLYASRARATA